MSIDKQYLREVAKQATGAHERMNAISADDIFDISLHHDGAQLDADIPAKLRRAAMLQAGTLTNEGTIPVTQFKPVVALDDFPGGLSDRESMLKLADWLHRLGVAIEDEWSNP
ncbi:ead/Ea22-like family protein [Escherichia coli]|uniref:ead/Ea22-like family protein n=1 Tax=Escherichia coli TaxID=562 RepID=UPI003F772819